MATEIKTVRFNPESGHWYDSQGRVVEAVPCSGKVVKGKKDYTCAACNSPILTGQEHWSGKDRRHVDCPPAMRPPELPDAREFGLVAGVTTFTGQTRKAGLEEFKYRELLLAALTLPRGENEPTDLFAERVIMDWQKRGKTAADAGTLLHAALNRYFCERILPDYEAAVNAVHAVDEWLRGFGATDIKGEVGFCVPGLYGGTADLTFRLGSILAVADFKTVEDTKLTKYQPYDENGWQLAGYGRGLGGTPTDRYFNIGIGRGSGLIAVSEWTQEDMGRNFEAFDLLLRLWMNRNKWPMPKEA